MAITKFNLPRVLCITMSSVALFLCVTGGSLIYFFEHERIPGYNGNAFEKVQVEGVVNEQSDLARLKSMCVAYISSFQELLASGNSARGYVAHIAARLSWVLCIAGAAFFVISIYLFRALGRKSA
jgi:hypothetical protein